MEDRGDKAVRVLVIEDDAAINDVVRRKLAKRGLSVTSAYSGTEAQLHLDAAADAGAFDIIICDLMLPGIPGEELVPLIRASHPSVPIIVISAKDATADKVLLLGMGADDYLTKPFDLDELAARVEVQLRRSASVAHGAGEVREAARDAIEHGPLRVDPSARMVMVEGREVSLTKTEFDMLALLAASPGRVFTKRELYESAWGEPYAAQESTVAAHISNVRSKLKPYGADGLIQTVWGIGFKLS